jgi:hypothetical protein
VEADTQGFGRVEGSNALDIHPGEAAFGLRGDALILPAHERMFADEPDEVQLQARSVE